MDSKVHFKKGSTEMIILKLLSDGDLYGYELSRRAASISGGVMDISMGAMYPILYKMLDNGYISEYEQKVKKRQKRIYYHIEPAGTRRLNELVETYLEVTNGIMKILDHVPETEHTGALDEDSGHQVCGDRTSDPQPDIIEQK